MSSFPGGQQPVELRFGSEIHPDAVNETLRKLFGRSAQATPTQDGGLSFKFDSSDGGDTSHDILSLPLRREGDGLAEKKKYDHALTKYKEALRIIVNGEFEVPLPFVGGGGIRSESYIKLECFRAMSLMGCCNEIGKCYQEMKNYKEALLWFEEVMTIAINKRFAKPEPIFDWIDYSILHHNFMGEQVASMASASQIFLNLGNSGAAVQRHRNALNMALMLPEDQFSPKFLRVKSTLEKEAPYLYQLRHPDPKFLQRGLQDSELQVLGSWKKLELSKASNLPSRFSVGSFVWRSRFYVCGGMKIHLGPFYRDFHYLDLKKLDRWRALPSYPRPESVTGMFIGWRMWVHDDKAYLFNGSTLIDYFDLVTEKWHQIRATWVPSKGISSFPFTRQMLVDFAVVYAHGKAYFFGGTHRSCNLGCALFTCLDLTTRKWQLLSGEHCPIVPRFDSPGPRRLPAMWANGAGDRIYLMFGEADRPGAAHAKQPHGQTEGFGYEDFWSWGIQEGSWRRERQPGNAPCPRSESSYSYNPVLNKTILFGGYHPSIPTVWPEQHTMFSFSYYADTFIYDDGSTSGSPPIWKHVVTSGFPSYRAQAEMFSDPDTGKVYLFGGYTNAQFVPQRKEAIMRSFNDIWQLRLDIPGGFFEGVDLEEEARTARAGPWQKCYNCGNTGPWKKCGGSCGGKVFFCNTECLREGWREHKTRHNCRKT